MVLVACGDDEQSPEGSPSTETSAPSGSEAPRLDCPGNVESFVVTGAPVGGTLPSSPNADAAAAAVAEERGGVEAVLIGPDEDGAGERYALVGGDGTVSEEVVVGEQSGGWTPVQYDTCA